MLELTACLSVHPLSWIGYEKEGFRGHQYLLEEGEYHDWTQWGGYNNELVSLRLIRTVRTASCGAGRVCDNSRLDCHLLSPHPPGLGRLSPTACPRQSFCDGDTCPAGTQMKTSQTHYTQGTSWSQLFTTCSGWI